MTVSNKGKQAPAEEQSVTDTSVNPLIEAAPARLATGRYFFNLTDGETMIRDEEGVAASSLQAAVVSALEAVEELRAQDFSIADEWRGWRLEIVDASGRAVQMILLDALSAH